MNLKFYFDYEAAGNPYFRQIYHGIFDRFKLEHPEDNITYEQPDYQKIEVSWGSPGGMSNFQIINEENNKTIVVSFWDRGMDLLLPGMGWEKYDFVQYIGGIGMSMTSEEIETKYAIKHSKFQYPLGNRDSLDNILKIRSQYDPSQKIRKAVFIGTPYGTRAELIPILSKNPLFEFIDGSAGFFGASYLQKINEYKVALCFNAMAETSIRDIEILGLGIPMLRSELTTQFFNPLIPDHHYIRASERCTAGCLIYPGIPMESIAAQFAESLEKVIDDNNHLINVSNNARSYFDSYCQTNYIVDLFFKVADLDLLK